METNRIVIKSPKPEHHAGHDQRTIPIFPELVQPLEECRDATGGGNLVFPMLVGRSAAYCRKPVLAAIEAAGIEPWDKLFVALRATRDTELRERYPSHVVDAWIGHDEAVAKLADKSIVTIDRKRLPVTAALFDLLVFFRIDT